MKVLIETVTNRKGYKNFANSSSFNSFLHKNHKKIKNYKILNEVYNGTFEELLQDVMKRADDLGQMLLCAFFGMTDQRDRYKNLLKASRYTSKIQSLVRGYLK